MANPEFPASTEGTPGSVVIDEFYKPGKGVILTYTSYKEDGDLRFYIELPRDESPRSISQYFKDCAEDLRCNPPKNMTDEDVEDNIEALLIESENVPGLVKKGEGK